RAGRADPAELLELVEDLPHADDADAAAGGIDDRVGNLPAELLDDLDAHRLLALDAIGLAAGAGVQPAVTGRRFGEDPEDVADGAVHAVDVGAVDPAALTAELGRVDGQRRVDLDAGARAVGGPRVAAAAHGRLRELRHAELLPARDGGGGAARL